MEWLDPYLGQLDHGSFKQWLPAIPGPNGAITI